MSNIYVGNLPFSTTQEDLQALFAQHGEVTSVNVITDRETGRARGFAFVEMSTGASEAISALNNYELDGRSLSVNEARPREAGGSRGRRW